MSGIIVYPSHQDSVIEKSEPAMYTISSLKAELNERGWRLTPQRETILQVFQNLPEGQHLSAEDLHVLLQADGEAISLSTITAI